MENTNKLTNLIQDAQAILAKHLEPNGPNENSAIRDLLQLLDGPRSREALVRVENKDFTPMEAKGTVIYLGRSGGFDVRDCPEPEALAAFIVAKCNRAEHQPFVMIEPSKYVQGNPFYTMDGQPCPPDIEDELGQLLLACDKAIEFLTVGPAIEVTEDVIQAMYNSNVVKLIPKLKAVLESRVSVKYPFAMLASIHGSRITEAGSAPIDHLLAATGAIEISNDRMMQNFENYTANIDTLNIGPNTMPYLADMVIHMQRIMTTFGWTWDDVKLKARQQMAEHE